MKSANIEDVNSPMPIKKYLDCLIM